MTVAFIAKLVVKPEKREELERLQIELRRITCETEPETPVYEVLRSKDDPNTFMVVATFKDQAAFDFHMGSSAHDELVPPILACLSEDMELTFYEALS